MNLNEFAVPVVDCRKTGTVRGDLMTAEVSNYIAGLRRNFSEYRRSRFAGQDGLFEPRAKGGAVVFSRGEVENNLLIPLCSKEDRQQIIAKISPAKRHRHFGSMQSSQALAQSVFGTIEVLKRLPLLSALKSEDGQLAFGPMLNHAKLELEKGIKTLGERPPRETSVDVWFEGDYRVAVECKLAEPEFGTCSRTRLKPAHKNFETQHCDGSYTLQRGRAERCALTAIGARYWQYVEEIFGWSSEIDHRQCPLDASYQLARNVLAACVGHDGKLHIDRAHALIIYDERNPAMAADGAGDRAWRAAHEAMRAPGTLRRLSWQAFIAQWPSDAILNWLKEELAGKYGLLPSYANDQIPVTPLPACDNAKAYPALSS